jgi:hypothetical protein
MCASIQRGLYIPGDYYATLYPLITENKRCISFYIYLVLLEGEDSFRHALTWLTF